MSSATTFVLGLHSLIVSQNMPIIGSFGCGFVATNQNNGRQFCLLNQLPIRSAYFIDRLLQDWVLDQLPAAKRRKKSKRVGRSQVPKVWPIDAHE
jgi:hypothetical protein